MAGRFTNLLIAVNAEHAWPLYAQKTPPTEASGVSLRKRASFNPAEGAFPALQHQDDRDRVTAARSQAVPEPGSHPAMS